MKKLIYTGFLLFCFSWNKGTQVSATSSGLRDMAESKEAKEKSEKQQEAVAATVLDYDTSIAGLRTLIESNSKSKTDVLQPTTEDFVIPWPELARTFDSYLEISKKHLLGPMLFVESREVPTDALMLSAGDLHGGIYPLLGLFDDWKSKGFLRDDYLLAPKVYVIFTGDYVDRGTASIEVLYALLLLKLKNWSQVTLIRGNHEDWSMNFPNGLVEELQHKYSNAIFQKPEGAVFPKIDLSTYIPQIWGTFPTALYVRASGAASCAVFLHGMVDPVLARATKEILAQTTSQPKVFSNSWWHTYVTGDVSWGDIVQFIETEDEEARRVENAGGLGRSRINQKWLENNFLNLYPEIKVIVRGHQHEVNCGLLFKMDALAKRDLYKKVCASKRLSGGPYFSTGPFPAEAAKDLISGWDESGKVITISAGKDIVLEGVNNSLGYVLLAPGAQAWDIKYINITSSNSIVFQSKTSSASAASAARV